MPTSKEERGEESNTDKQKDVAMTQFKEGEKVLAFHGPLIYEAKIQKIEQRKNEGKYFVHYLGWNKNWDEWIGEDRVLPFSKENLEKQKALLGNHDKRGKARGSQSKQPKAVAVKGKKRKNEEQEKDGEEADAAKFLLPPGLRRILLDDEELIRNGLVPPLPRSPNVQDILNRYMESKTKRDSSCCDALAEILSGIRSYFDKVLSTMLLYKEERKQHQEMFANSTLTPSAVYGTEHLLRLFVKLPDLLQYANLEEEASSQLHQQLMSFLKFIQKNQTTYFHDALKIDMK